MSCLRAVISLLKYCSNVAHTCFAQSCGYVYSRVWTPIRHFSLIMAVTSRNPYEELMLTSHPLLEANHTTSTARPRSETSLQSIRRSSCPNVPRITDLISRHKYFTIPQPTTSKLPRLKMRISGNPQAGGESRIFQARLGADDRLVAAEVDLDAVRGLRRHL